MVLYNSIPLSINLMLIGIGHREEAEVALIDRQH